MNINKKQYKEFKFNLIFFIVIASIFLIDFLLKNVSFIFCPFELITGIPCPLCGSTRALSAVMEGNISEGLNYNPAIFITLITMLLILFYPLTNKKISKYILYALVLVIFLSYLYQIIFNFNTNEVLRFDNDSLVGLIINFFN